MLSKEEVIKIAKLAKLELTDAEVEKYQKDLSAILDYAEQLQEVDTDNVEPLYQVTGLEHVVRQDEASAYDKEIMKKLVEASPQGQEENQYLVKSILD